jgi:hypothetical protein
MTQLSSRFGVQPVSNIRIAAALVLLVSMVTTSTLAFDGNALAIMHTWPPQVPDAVECERAEFRARQREQARRPSPVERE